MLLKGHTLEGIVAGTVVTVFRRWGRPRVKTGSTIRTSVGVIAVDGVEPTSVSAITDRSAQQAGFASRAELLAELAKYSEGRLYRISVRLVGPDPRLALRESRLDEKDASSLERRVASLGARTAGGPWAVKVLRLIGERPGGRAADLARSVGMDTALFKPRVRQLKELGLTESLEVGYRLSPRGRSLLRRLDSR